MKDLDWRMPVYEGKASRELTLYLGYTPVVPLLRFRIDPLA